MKAVDGYDPERGHSSVTTRWPTILGELRGTSGIRAGRYTYPVG